jgi:hypothetical protein
MAGNTDTQELTRHQADFRGFMRAATWGIVLIVITLGLLAIFVV